MPSGYYWGKQENGSVKVSKPKTISKKGNWEIIVAFAKNLPSKSWRIEKRRLPYSFLPNSITHLSKTLGFWYPNASCLYGGRGPECKHSPFFIQNLSEIWAKTNGYFWGWRKRLLIWKSKLMDKSMKSPKSSLLRKVKAIFWIAIPSKWNYPDTDAMGVKKCSPGGHWIGG